MMILERVLATFSPSGPKRWLGLFRLIIVLLSSGHGLAVGSPDPHLAITLAKPTSAANERLATESDPISVFQPASLWHVYSRYPKLGELGPKLDKGVFLVASRQLRDPNFVETVVLLLHYGEDGVVGVIVNRPTKMSLSQVLPQLKGSQGKEDSLYLGGPVLPKVVTLLVRLSEPLEGSEHVFKDVYFSYSSVILKRMLARDDHASMLRAYAGYAGWSSDQLEEELERGDWHVLGADVDQVFAEDPEQLWPELIRRTSTLMVHRSGVESPRELTH